MDGDQERADGDEVDDGGDDDVREGVANGSALRPTRAAGPLRQLGAEQQELMERMEKRLAEVERLLGAAEARTVSDDRRDTDVEAMRAMIAGEISALGNRAEPADDAHRKAFERLQSELSEVGGSIETRVDNVGGMLAEQLRELVAEKKEQDRESAASAEGELAALRVRARVMEQELSEAWSAVLATSKDNAVLKEEAEALRYENERLAKEALDLRGENEALKSEARGLRKTWTISSNAWRASDYAPRRGRKGGIRARPESRARPRPS